MGRREISNKNLMWSVAALVLVLLLIPAALGGLNAMNDAYAAGYVDVYHATPPEQMSSSTWALLYHPVVLQYTNVSGNNVYADQSAGTFTVTNETYTETVIFSAPSDYSQAYSLVMQYNESVDDLYNNSADRLHIEYSSGSGNGNVIVSVYGFDAAVTSTTVPQSILMSENVTVINGSVSTDIGISVGEFLTCLSGESSYTTPKLFIRVVYDNYTLSDGDEIDFAYTFEKQRGVSESSMTPYIVGGLGGLLLVSAVAATDVVDPLSPGKKIHLWKRKRSGHRRRRRW